MTITQSTAVTPPRVAPVQAIPPVEPPEPPAKSDTTADDRREGSQDERRRAAPPPVLYGPQGRRIVQVPGTSVSFVA